MVLAQSAISNSTAQYLILGIASFALTGLLTWPVRALAIRLGAMDAPNLGRKTQTEPVPYLGGVAIALGITIITFAAIFVGGNATGENNDQLKDLALTILLPALALGAMGLFDDLRSLSPWPRLIAQTVVGTVVAFVVVENGTIGTPFGYGSSGSWINTTVTIFWIVGICNSINFFDNLDGAASGAVTIAALGVFVISFNRGQELVSALSIVTAGATSGFLMWNKSPAKIYMGDAGALFLGIIISVATIRLDPSISPTWKSLAIPVLLMAVPILDTCVVVSSRIAKGDSPLLGGRDHLSHRLLNRGMNKRSAVLFLYFLSAIFALIGNLFYFLSPYIDPIHIVFVLAFWLGLFFWFSCIPTET